MRFLSSFGRWFKNTGISKHKTLVGSVFVLIVGFGLFGPTHETWAASSLWEFSQAPLATMILWISLAISYVTAALGQMILGLIEMIIVPILQYNGFSDSPTISLGWSLVRDVVNMFVVIVLLFIAITTILGNAKKPWQDLLPKFLLAVILVNFSRTICGLLIDVSQVIMFTFVNALLDVAAGNFAQLLGLQDFGQYAQIAEDAGGGVAGAAGAAITAGQQLGAAYLLFALYAAIFAVMLLLALVFIYRIIVLWILVIMSPLTFFLGGIKDVFPQAGGSHSQWWSQFSAALTLGPMLTFFLWLSLAAASRGSIPVSEHFPLPENPSAVTLLTFQTDNLLSVLLGLILLVVGMQQSAKSASAVGGMAGSLINEKMGRRIVSGTVGAPLRGLYRGGQEAARQADRRLGAQVGASSFTVAAASAMGADLTKLASKVPLAGPALGRASADLTGRIQAPIEAQVAKEQKAAKERVSHYTDDQLADHYRLLAEGKTSALGLSTKDDLDAMATRFSTDGGFRKKIKEKISAEQYQNLLKTSYSRVHDKKDALLDDKGKEGFNKFLSQNPELLLKTKEDGSIDTSKMDEFIDSEKFTPRELSEAAAGNEHVLESLKKKVVRVGKGGKEITAYDDVLRGIHGQKLKKAAEKAGAKPRDIGDEDGDDKGGGAPSANNNPPPAPPVAPAVAAGAVAAAAAAGVPGYGFRQQRPPRRSDNGGGNNNGGGGSSGGGPAPASGGVPPVIPPAGGGPVAPPTDSSSSSAPANVAPAAPVAKNASAPAKEAGPLVTFDAPPPTPREVTTERLLQERSERIARASRPKSRPDRKGFTGQRPSRNTPPPTPEA
jgi:hypothetical protein